VAWALQCLYSADPPYNCFPSLHVAHSVLSALVCYRVHRRVGVLAIGCASLIALSTLFTKQHYVLDVVAGAFMGCVAHAIFFRRISRMRVPELDRRLAPIFAVATFAIAGLGITSYWIAYRLTLRS
jgi:membrane-associated phospholipid phosphatase